MLAVARRSFVALAITLPLAAQTAAPAPAAPKATEPPKLTAASFLPRDYTMIAHADLKALRERDVWEELTRSLLGTVLKQMERESGFALDDLDLAQAVAVLATPEEGVPDQTHQMLLFEGHAKLGLPDWLTRSQSYRRGRIGEVDTYERGAEHGEIGALVVPNLFVFGAREQVAPVLAGKPTNGRPAADLQSLLSGRGDNLLYVVIPTTVEQIRQQVLVKLLGNVSWPEDDLPTFVMARVRALGKDDDTHLEVEAVIRHRLGKAGLDASEAAAKAWFASLQEHPRLGALKALWKSIELRREGPDLVVRKDLGRPRDAIGTLAILLAPLVNH